MKHVSKMMKGLLVADEIYIGFLKVCQRIRVVELECSPMQGRKHVDFQPVDLLIY
jgi:hypothetical protein